MCKSPAQSGMAGACSPSLTTELESNRSSPIKFSAYSSGFTDGMSTLAAALAWRSASGSSSNMAAVFGWSSQSLAEDRRSASPSPPTQDSSIEEGRAREIYTILLVEDSATDVFVIKEILAGAGLKFRVDVVKDGQEALRYLQRSGAAESSAESHPALVLLDLNVPKVSGLEVLAQLKASSKWQSIPVIIVSSSRADEDHKSARQLGADAYFEKPSDLQSYRELARIVERVLGGKSPA